MRLLYFSILIVCMATPALATYTYVIDSYGPVPDLYGTETLLMIDEGGDHMLSLWEYSSATIQGTSQLELGSGGIWYLSLFGYSNLDFSGGEVHQLDLNSYAKAELSGGRIDYIYSYQNAWVLEGDPPVWVPNPHITMVCNLDYELIYTGDDVTGVTGTWLDGTEFDITLVNVYGYSPAIDNIQFIPEPATILLLGLGGVLLRRKR